MFVAQSTIQQCKPMIEHLSRRDLIKFSAAAMSLAAFPARSQPSQLWELTLLQTADAIRSGEISAEEYAKVLIARNIEFASLNTLISSDFDVLLRSARAAARQLANGENIGPLHGVPLVLKDNIATSSLPSTSGTGALKNFQPRQNATVVQSLFDAGALLLGKSNMHELAAGITSNNDIYGAVQNPYDTAMIPGGSSGGTAVAIAAGLAPAGLGTDTGGSCRIPAALCGIAGMRPTQGRYGDDGHVPHQSATATIGPMARNIADLALLDAVITGADVALEPITPGELRLGIPESPFRHALDDEIAPAIERTFDTLIRHGVTLVAVEIDGLENLLNSDARMLSSFESRRQYEEFFSMTGIAAEDYVNKIGNTQIQSRLRRQLLGPASDAPDDRASAAKFRSTAATLLDRYFVNNKLDGMIIPTTPLAARPIGQEQTVQINGQPVPTFQTYIRNTLIGSAAGIPCISIPAGLTSAGLPVGIEVDGPAGSDRRLLQIASLIESLLPQIPRPSFGTGA